MKRTLVGIIAVAAGMASPAAADDKFWHTLADVGKYGIPVAAAGISLYEKDTAGLIDLAETGAVTAGATEALKYAVDERRPDGGRHSFPSGHTSIAFAGAGYLHARYGWEVGLPFELFAGLVGYSRVHTHDHHWYDVVAGAAIGEGSAFIFTRRLNDRVRLSPYGDSSGGGFHLAAQF
ncbi:MAG: phosphatase PAP2 family protein [Janthinobacterium lividum]